MMLSSIVIRNKIKGSGFLKRLKNAPVIIILLLVLFVTTACGTTRQVENGMKKDTADRAPQTEAAGQAESKKQHGSSTGDTAGVQDRKIVKNAQISIDVTDIDVMLEKLEVKVNSVNGYISSSSLYKQNDNKKRCRAAIRIPAEKFSGVLDWLENTGKVQNKNISTDDVTEQYIDLQARIDNLEAQEKRLKEILTSAKTVDGILKVEKELERVRGELESLTGKLKYLKNRLAYSKINISLQETAAASKNISSPGIGSISQRSISAFTASANAVLSSLASLVVFFIGAIPVLLPLGLIGAAAYWMRKKHLGKKEK